MIGTDLRDYILTQKEGHDGSNPHLATAPDGTPVFIRLSAALIAGAEYAATVQSFLARYRQLHHPSLIKVRDYWIADGPPGWLVLVTEVANGGCLRSLAQRHGPLAADRLIDLLRPLAEAIDFLHAAGITHANIKPDNLLLRAGMPCVDVPRLPPCRPEFAACVTADYAAPEQCRGQPDPPSDQYSLAASYVELRLGRPLFFPNRPTDPASLQNHLEERGERFLKSYRLKLWKLIDKLPLVRKVPIWWGRWFTRPMTGVATRQGSERRFPDMVSLINCHLEQEPDLEPLPAAEREVLRIAVAKAPEQRYPSCVAFVQALEAASASRRAVAGA
jgi:serine/threonine protein kinase